MNSCARAAAGLLAVFAVPAIAATYPDRPLRLTRLPEAREQFAAQGAEGIGSTPEEFATHLRTEIDKWAKVAKAAKMHAE